MDSKDKKRYRQIKRNIKKAGTRRLRQRLKNNLAAHPEGRIWMTSTTTTP